MPKGLSFPLKRSLLDAGLGPAGLSEVVSVYYTTQQGASTIRGRPAPDTVLRATFCGEGHRGSAGAGTVSIYVFAVLSQERKRIEEAIQSEVLPALSRWL